MDDDFSKRIRGRALQRVLHEQMPTRDDVERATDRVGEVAEDHRVRGPAMIRREHDAVARVERRAESFDAATLDTDDAVAPAEIERKDRAEEVPPQFATIRRDEAVGFRDDDVLHLSLIHI